MLTEAEVRDLINEIKKLVERETIYLPSRGENLQKNAVSTINKHNQFKIDIFRGRIDGDRYNFHARYANTNTPILRIDLGEVVHKNPDGNKISGPHMHVYKDGLEINHAIPFDVANKDITDICVEFFYEINIIDNPSIVQLKDIDDYMN